jgi:hypothetical protein
MMVLLKWLGLEIGTTQMMMPNAPSWWIEGGSHDPETPSRFAAYLAFLAARDLVQHVGRFQNC